MLCVFFFFVKQKTAYEMRISDWSSDVCSSDLFSEKAQIAGLRADVLNFAIPAEKARLGLGNAAGIFRVLSPDKHVGDREAIVPDDVPAAEDREKGRLSGRKTQNGRASGRDRGCQSWEILGGAGWCKKKDTEEKERSK